MKIIPHVAHTILMMFRIFITVEGEVDDNLPYLTVQSNIKKPLRMTEGVA
jgi:hypothetical protein